MLVVPSHVDVAEWAQTPIWGVVPSLTYLVFDGGGGHRSPCAVVGGVAEPRWLGQPFR